VGRPRNIPAGTDPDIWALIQLVCPHDPVGYNASKLPSELFKDVAALIHRLRAACERKNKRIAELQQLGPNERISE